jgi:cytochrome oxidase assembly protein ShyY1
VSEPELTEANHLSYAFQWFIFAACVVVGWVLAVRRSVRTHRAAVAAGT